MMAQIFGDRAEANEIKGVILYQIPNGEMAVHNKKTNVHANLWFIIAK